MQRIEEKSEYDIEVENNTRVFSDLVKQVRPDIWLIMDLLDQTKVNHRALWKAIRQINNIAIGTGYGQVHIVIENGVITFIRGEEADKLNEPALLKGEES